MKFSEKLKICRKNSKMSQEQLAEKLNVSRQAITKWETGLGLPELDNLVAIATLFGVTLDEMVSEHTIATPLKAYLSESTTEYDLGESKHFDLDIGSANRIHLCGYDGEKLKISLMSNSINAIEQAFKVKLDDTKKRIDVSIKRADHISETQCKKELYIKIMLPVNYLSKIELQANARHLLLEQLSLDRFELDGKIPQIFLSAVAGHFEFNCNLDMSIVCENVMGRIDINQINATSIITIPKDMSINATVKGIGTRIFFTQDGERCYSFSDENAQNVIELNGMKSELIIERAETAHM